MLLDHLQSHLQPWFKADVQRILDEPGTAAVRNGTYLSMHIRRTDKKREARPRKTEVCEACQESRDISKQSRYSRCCSYCPLRSGKSEYSPPTPTNGAPFSMHSIMPPVFTLAKETQLVFLTQQEYFQKTVQYLRKSVDGLTAADISGLWLSTDEDAVYNEVGCLVVLRGHGFSRCHGCFESVDSETQRHGFRNASSGTRESWSGRTRGPCCEMPRFRRCCSKV